MDLIETILGPSRESSDINALQMGARALLIYLITLAIIRLGKKRFMGQATAFDVIIGIVLGSIVSRAITGNAPMVPAMTSAAVLMLLHWGLSALAVRWDGFGNTIKGYDRILIKDGQVDEQQLCAAHMTHHDLLEALREQGVGDAADVSEARLERGGSISVIKKSSLKVLSVDVLPGVQTVRIEIA